MSKKKQKAELAQKNKKSGTIVDRLKVLVAGIVLLFATMYGHNITSEREYLLKNASTQKVVVTRASSRRRGPTVYVQIGQYEYDAGLGLGKYKNVKAGDTVEIHYLPGFKYPALTTGKFRNLLIFQYIMFVTGGVLILIALLYPSDKKKWYRF
ncbi:MAG: hypothetical protein QM762_14785 [Chryseolinea sp.]